MLGSFGIKVYFTVPYITVNLKDRSTVGAVAKISILQPQSSGINHRLCRDFGIGVILFFFFFLAKMDSAFHFPKVS